MEFYDGEKRPEINGDWTQEELDRVCKNCGKRFGEHSRYDCH